jgi:hypothetical protein
MPQFLKKALEWVKRKLRRLDPDRYRLGPAKYDEEKMAKFFAELYQRQEFRAYFAHKDYSLMKALASGTLDKEKYDRLYGQREMLVDLLNRSEVYFNRQEREKEK